jgi:hypothetical protein
MSDHVSLTHSCSPHLDLLPWFSLHLTLLHIHIYRHHGRLLGDLQIDTARYEVHAIEYSSCHRVSMW